MVSTQDSESCDPSSNLGGTLNIFKLYFQILISFYGNIVTSYYQVAVIAQLGERQTEDLKVPGSIPGRGSFGQFIFEV